jgi:hypothetical protein
MLYTTYIHLCMYTYLDDLEAGEDGADHGDAGVAEDLPRDGVAAILHLYIYIYIYIYIYPIHIHDIHIHIIRTHTLYMHV